MDVNSGKWIRREGAAKRAGVSVRTIDNKRKEGKIRSCYDGLGRVWINVEDLDRLTVPMEEASA